MVYSCSTDKMFCNPCVLFSKDIDSAFTDTSNRYYDWKHINSNLSIHENTIAHLTMLHQVEKIGKSYKKAIEYMIFKKWWKLKNKNGVIFF